MGYALLRDEPMTLEEWGDLPEDEEGELVDGMLVEEEEVSTAHDLVGGWLCTELGIWAKEHGGFVGVSDTKFGLSPTRGRKPDLWLWLPDTPRPSLRDAVSRLPPALMVEILSARPRDHHRDRVQKMGEYAQFGVRNYWIVDPQVRLFELLGLGTDGRYVQLGGGTEGRLDVPGFPGLTLDLDALWAHLDQFGGPSR